MPKAMKRNLSPSQRVMKEKPKKRPKIPPNSATKKNEFSLTLCNIIHIDIGSCWPILRKSLFLLHETFIIIDLSVLCSPMRTRDRSKSPVQPLSCWRLPLVFSLDMKLNAYCQHINNSLTHRDNVKWSESKSVGCWSTNPNFRYLHGFSQPVKPNMYSYLKFLRLRFRSSISLKNIQIQINVAFSSPVLFFTCTAGDVFISAVVPFSFTANLSI